MKATLLFFALALAAGFNAHAEDPKPPGPLVQAEALAANTPGAATAGLAGGAVDLNKSCSCRCTPQGILLRECGDETENLGNYGNLKNCNLQRESHPQCQSGR